MTWLQRLYRRMAYGAPLIVVSGLPRSGTSMMMKMLEAGGVPIWSDGIRTADESNPKGYYELERVKDLDKVADKAWVREGRGKAVKVISSLLEHLPRRHNYQVLFMHRHFDEIIASQDAMLGRRGESAGTASPEALAKMYESHLRKIKHFLAHEPGFQALDVHYREVLDQPAPQVRRISEFLGGGLDVDRMAGVVDHELYRNRRQTAR